MCDSGDEKKRHLEFDQEMNYPDGNRSDEEIPQTKKPKTDDICAAVAASSMTAEACDETIGLLDMPNEILEMIVEKLPFREIVQLRRVCKKFKAKFPAFCKNPVVSYDSRELHKAGGMIRLREIIADVTFSCTRTLTISQRKYMSGGFFDSAIMEDLKLRCPRLKRLILNLESPCSAFEFVRLSIESVRLIPASVKLELHKALLFDRYTTVRLHGIFQGPFDNWTIEYVKSRLKDPGFYQPIDGVWMWDSVEESDEDDTEDEEEDEENNELEEESDGDDEESDEDNGDDDEDSDDESDDSSEDAHEYDNPASSSENV